MVKLIPLLLFLFISVSSYDSNLWGLVISTSDNYDNYRHSVNSLLMYNILRNNGIPDEHIVLALAEYHACEARNFYPGKILLSDNGKILNTCQKDMYLDYKEQDVHNYQILDILRGRKMSLFNQFRQLNTDKNSRIIIIVTSHGGENFIKVRGKLVILSDELNRTLNEMYIKQRYKEIVFVLDTCEGYSLFDNVNVPNVYFVASALLNQKASSYSFDGNIMGPTADKFHFLLWRKLTEIAKNQDYDMKMDTLFDEIKEKKDFLTTDVTILNKIDRNLTLGEFFGDSRLDNHQIETYGNITLDFDEEAAQHSFEFNLNMLNHKKEMNKGVMQIKQYKEDHYTLQENKESSKGKVILGAFGVVLSVNILLALFF